MTTLLFALLTLLQDPTDPPIGAWEGTLDAGAVKIRMILRIEAGKDGALAGKMDVPTQGVEGVVLDECAYKDGRLRFRFDRAGFRYEGKRSEDGESFTGTFRQGGGAFPVTFKKTDAPAALRRPQTPKPPFPYDERAASFESAPGVRLDGTLTVPKGKGPYPAVVLVSGSGPQDRDESLAGHKPFLILADHLSRRGIAVLRYDDRGTGKSTGDHGKATSKDFAVDAAAGVAWLRKQEGIDPDRVGVAGHSEGGLIAPMVAAEDPKLAFIVLLAGPGVTGDRIILRQAELIARKMGADEAALELNRKTQERIFEAIRKEPDPEKARAEVRRILGETLSPAQVEAQARFVGSPWFRFFLTYDPIPTLTKVKCPVLALCGEKDLQVDPKQNLPPIEKALSATGVRGSKAVELPGLNHLFQTCETGLLTKYGEIEETFAPAALEAVSSWILERTR